MNTSIKPARSIRTFRYAGGPEYVNFMSPRGDVISFYRGYASVTDPQAADYLLENDNVTEVTGEKDLVIPVPPERSRSRNWASASGSDTPDTSVSHLELLQRAVASSAHTPQAAESTSTQTAKP